MDNGNGITVSVVSHGQSKLVSSLLDSLKMCDLVTQIIITINLPDDTIAIPKPIKKKICFIQNPTPKGFGANHNYAFERSESEYFAVLNPDISFVQDPFPELLECLSYKQAGVAAPRVIDINGEVENSARHFPKVLEILLRLIGINRKPAIEMNQIPENKRKSHTACQKVDWVGGMFMLFKSKSFRLLCGFDEKYFLYYEDVDVCFRLKQIGIDRRYCYHATVIHDARRDSHRNIKYLKWHLQRMMRFFLKVYFSRAQ